MSTFTVARHPNANSRTSTFKWGVFLNGQLYEGFRTRDAAERAAASYNAGKF